VVGSKAGFCGWKVEQALVVTNCRRASARSKYAWSYTLKYAPSLDDVAGDDDELVSHTYVTLGVMTTDCREAVERGRAFYWNIRNMEATRTMVLSTPSGSRVR